MHRLTMFAVLAACSHERGPISRMPFAEHVDEDVVVATVGTTTRAHVTRAPEGIMLVDAHGQPMRFDRIDAIETVDAGGGAATGALIGGATGGVIGAVTGYVVAGTHECHGELFCPAEPPTRGFVTVVTGMTLGLSGALLGALVGVAVGERDVWRRDGLTYRF